MIADKSHSRNYGGAGLPEQLDSRPHPLPPLVQLATAHDFAVQQHSPATRKASRSDFALFTLWCTARGHSACPAAPDAICAFIADEAMSGTKVATITRRIAAIRYAHALKGNRPAANKFRSRQGHHEGHPANPWRSPDAQGPATHGIIADMIACCPDTLRGTRDRTLLLLGFAGAFRRSELAALTVADLETNQAGVRVTVRRSKTDQEGKGQVVAILAGTRLKPVLAVATWLAAAGINEGSLFRAIDRHGNVLPEPLSAAGATEHAVHRGDRQEARQAHRTRCRSVQRPLAAGRIHHVSRQVRRRAVQDHGRQPPSLGRDGARLCPGR